MPAEPYLYEIEASFQAGLLGKKPPMSFNPTSWEESAKKTLSANAWRYVSGNAGPGETEEKNRAAFRKWSIIPSRLVQTKYPSLSTTKIFNTEGEIAVATAAAELNVPFALSSATCTSFEDLSKAMPVSSQKWYELYWPSNVNNDLTVTLLKRAKAAGFTALFVTIDTYAMGWRYVDMDNGYNPFLVADHVGVELGLTDPLFQQKFRAKHGVEATNDIGQAAKEWASIHTPGTSHTWEDLNFLKQHWDGPIVLKCIQSVADAKKAVEFGMQGIVVSNHGGRQQDGVPGTLESLPAIVDVVGEKLDVFFDSGVRSGVDIAKALALGAKCVLVGRPYIWGLAIDGKKGVVHVLKALLGEFQMTLHQAGIPSVTAGELNRDRLLCST
ncbi:FMN-dependent alpha-hydroxy acid dehydrogenase [Cadophora sp. DSE1049]|nr:FMN-dependent alpha-hydroxy acid dehydrogenase [Cadophora sp. DSE1049]